MHNFNIWSAADGQIVDTVTFTFTFKMALGLSNLVARSMQLMEIVVNTWSKQPRSAARFKPAVHPKSKLTKFPEYEQ